MRVMVLGAAGGAGRHAVRLAEERGRTVTAVARRLQTPADSVRRVAGDVRDPGDVTPLLPGADAVLWCVGVTALAMLDPAENGEWRAAAPYLLAAADR